MFRGSGFRVAGFQERDLAVQGFRSRVSRFGISCFVFRVFRVSCCGTGFLRCGVPGTGFRCAEFSWLGVLGFMVWGSGFRVRGIAVRGF